MDLQDRICGGLEELDGSGTKFVQDLWERPGGGGGRTRVFAGGDVIVKGGVNFSHVHGPMPAKIANKLKLDEGAQFHATGVSIVLHPLNPYVPIIHSNVRYFEVEGGTFWFGGGIDVTPAYIDLEQGRAFHQLMKDTCDKTDSAYYPKFKKWADDYFYLPHRNETRGIGGIFFDHLRTDKDKHFQFVQDVGNAFVPSYRPLVEQNRVKAYGQRELDWQLHRRSRYVEFNLVHDAGTKFGLETGGRTESILMSMPPMASWGYAYAPEPDTPEAETQSLLKPMEWVPIHV